MKSPWLIISVLFLFPFFAQAQFEGKFCANGRHFSECIHFQKDGTFSYRYEADCNPTANGNGKYTLIQDTLSLYFSAQTPIIPKYDVVFSPSDAYYSEIEYWAIWEIEKDSCMGCKIEFFNAESELIGTGFSMGKERSIIQIPRNKKIENAIAYSFTDSVSIPLKSDSDAKIKVFFPSGEPTFQNDTLQFKIKHKMPNKIVMARTFEPQSDHKNKRHYLRFTKR